MITFYVPELSVIRLYVNRNQVACAGLPAATCPNAFNTTRRLMIAEEAGVRTYYACHGSVEVH